MPELPSDDAERADVFTGVGEAITAWARVEESLCSILITCLGPTSLMPPHGGRAYLDPGPASAAFYAVENFRSKLAVVDAVLRARLRFFQNTDDLLRAWTKIYAKARSLSKSRNKLAHRSLITFVDLRPGQRAQLAPPPHHPAFREYGTGGKQGITANQLKHMQLGFNLLADKCGELALSLAAHPELHSRFAALVAHQMENDAHSNNQSALAELKRALSWPD